MPLSDAFSLQLIYPADGRSGYESRILHFWQDKKWIFWNMDIFENNNGLIIMTNALFWGSLAQNIFKRGSGPRPNGWPINSGVLEMKMFEKHWLLNIVYSNSASHLPGDRSPISASKQGAAIHFHMNGRFNRLRLTMAGS